MLGIAPGDVPNVLGLVGIGLTLIGLGLTTYTFLRVRRVAQAQDEATAFTQELLNIDQLEVDLVRVMAALRTSTDPDGASLRSELGVTLGRVQGVRRALGSGKRHRGKARDNISLSVGSDFFGQGFNADAIQSAKEKVEIITGRTRLVADYYVLDCLRQACEHGVKVRVIGLSAKAPDTILEDAVKTVANPAPHNAAEYRRQIESNSQEILQGVKEWPAAARLNFEYRVSSMVPRVSMLRSDGVVNFGFLQLYRDAQPRELRERQYIKVPISLALGRVMLKHFDLVWNESEPVLIDGEPTTEMAGNSH